MIIAANIKKMLDEHHVTYRIIDCLHAMTLEDCVVYAGISREEVLSPEILADSLGVVMVVVPLAKKIDFDQLKVKLRRNLRVVPESRASSIFNDCTHGVNPPFGRPYGVDLIIDSSITDLDSIYFQAGSTTALLQISTDDYLYLSGGAQVLPVVGAERICSIDINRQPQEQQHGYVELSKLFKLPNLPNVAREILQLNLSKNTSIAELAHIISTDEVIKQQILSFANLSLATDGGDDVQHVIEHILGFEQVSHIALGVSAGSALCGQEQITDAELHNFWLHSLCCAALAEAIATKVTGNGDIQVNPHMSYISGLLHNLGILLFGQLFSREYALLKKWIKLNPKVPITFLENRLLAMEPRLNIICGGHAQLGAWLLKDWGMPEELCVVAMEHHHPNYSGKHSGYVRIIWLANRILKKSYGIGDGAAGNISSDTLQELGITAAELDTIVTNVMAYEHEFSNLASGFR